MKARSMLSGVIGATLMIVLPRVQGASGEPVPEIGADHLLRESCRSLQGAEAFSFKADITYDEVLPSGRKLQFAGTFRAQVQRPDRLRAVYRGDLRTASIWFDGERFTLFDESRNLYATAEAPGDLDALLDRTVAEYGFSLPVADLFYSDPYSVLSERAENVLYAGMHAVDGFVSHHLAVEQEDIDWQLWIDEGERRLPRKLTITYKNLPGSPQYTAVFSEWNFAPAFSDGGFTFEPPAGAERIDFLPGGEGE